VNIILEEIATEKKPATGAGVKCRTSIVFGSHDTIVDNREALRMAMKLKAGVLKVFGADHISIQESRHGIDFLARNILKR